jgi:hypothetical protein
MRKPKYQEKDRVLPLRQSYIYIVDSYYYDEELDKYIYEVHGLTSPTNIKYFHEDELSFAGFTPF